MSAYAYHDLLLWAQQLPVDEQVRFIEELFGSMNKQLEPLKSVEDTVRQIEEDLKLIEDALVQAHQKTGTQRRHSITELRGLGKEIWEGIDAQEYVDQERNSWDG